MNINSLESETLLSDVSVVTLSFNRKDELLNNLPNLCKVSAQAGFELIVVDNASTDGSIAFLRELIVVYPSLRLVLNDENMGVARGRNIGWRLASKKYILNIDDDLHIDETGIYGLLKMARENCRAGVISPRIIHAITHEKQCDHGEKNCQISNYHGACHIVRADVFHQVGDIDPECSFGGEELDYSIRVRAAGFDVIYSPAVTVKHNSLARVGVEGVWRRRQWVYNFTRVFFKHFPFWRAAILSGRYALSHIISGRKKFGITFAITLIPFVVRGATTGRIQYQCIPVWVREFYANPELRPEYGNVSLISKIFRMGSLSKQ